MADEPKPSETDPRPQAGRALASARRKLGWAAAFVALCAVIALNVVFIVKKTEQHAPLAAPSGSAGAATAFEPADAASAPLVPTPAPSQAAESGFDEGEPEPAPPKPAVVKRFKNVQEAAVQSCSTGSVEGLSRQIIEQARCLKRNAFVPLPTRPNLVLGAHVFPYLELETRDHLLKALSARANAKMTINSALRTVAQQYLVRRWSATRRCGVQLATSPGESNHETGTALDIAEAADWRPTLEAQNFRWLGASDRVHFDYKGNSPSRAALDVLAFQTLWNRNHPTDLIPTDGRYTPATEERLKKAPPEGFTTGPSCGKSTARR